MTELDDELEGRDEVTQRRIRKNLDRLAKLVAESDDPDRFFKWLEQQAAEEQAPMAKEHGQIGLRLPLDLLQRVDDMIPRLAADPNVAALIGKITRSTVIKLALARGLDQLDDELPAEKAAKKATRKAAKKKRS